MADIIRHLVGWKDMTRKTVEALKRLRSNAEANRKRLANPDDVVGYCEHFIDLFDGYAGDFDRLIEELPKGVRPRHLETVKQLYESSLNELDGCIGFKNQHIERSLPDESMRRLLDDVYRETRGSVEDYRDLSNLNHRLKTFVGEEE